MSLSTPDAIVAAIGWTLIRLLWSPLVVFAFLQLVRVLVGPALPLVRYAAGCFAMLSVVMIAVASFSGLIVDSNERSPVRQSDKAVSVGSPSFRPAGELETTSFGRVRFVPVGLPTLGERFAASLVPWIPTIVVSWAVGVILLMIRQISVARAIRSFRARCHPCGLLDSDRYAALARKMGLNRCVTFLTTPDLQMPGTLGWIRPVVLLPVCLATSYTVEEIDAMIAHELAHVRRLDALVEAIQQTTENLLFFSPGVWLISSAIRQDREVCCDFAAVAVSGGEKAYASMLLRSAENLFRPTMPHVGLSFAGGSLLGRVRALASKSRATHSSMTGSIMTLLVCSACVLLLGASEVQSSRLRGERAAIVATSERSFLATLFPLPQPSTSFADAYTAAINGDRNFSHLVDETVSGCDLDLVWRHFTPLIKPDAYPTLKSEYPPGWPFRSPGDHDRLIRAVWRYTKSLQSSADRHRAAKAALLLACMRREQGSLQSLVTIATDKNLADVSGLDAVAVARLRLYWSATSDAVALLVQRLRTSPQRGIDDLPSSDHLLDSTGRRPDLAFVAGYLTQRDERMAGWRRITQGSGVSKKGAGVSANGVNSSTNTPAIVEMLTH